MGCSSRPGDSDVLEVRAEVYRKRRENEQSLMARGIYKEASKT